MAKKKDEERKEKEENAKGAVGAFGDEEFITPEEEAKVKERLKKLGYL